MYLFGLGQSGSKLWIDRLKGILEDEDEKGREVVIEALEKLYSRQTPILTEPAGCAQKAVSYGLFTLTDPWVWLY